MNRIEIVMVFILGVVAGAAGVRFCVGTPDALSSLGRAIDENRLAVEMATGEEGETDEYGITRVKRGAPSVSGPVTTKPVYQEFGDADAIKRRRQVRYDERLKSFDVQEVADRGSWPTDYFEPITHTGDIRGFRLVWAESQGENCTRFYFAPAEGREEASWTVYDCPLEGFAQLLEGAVVARHRDGRTIIVHEGQVLGRAHAATNGESWEELLVPDLWKWFKWGGVIPLSTRREVGVRRSARPPQDFPTGERP